MTPLMKKTKKLLIIQAGMLFLAAGLFCTPYALAEGPDDPEKVALPEAVEAGLSYALELSTRKDAAFDQKRIMPLLNLVTGKGFDAKNSKPARRKSGRGIGFHAEIEAPFERILRYAYNPDIPSFIVNPSVLRLSGWYPESDIVVGKIKLWDELSDLKEPLLLWGTGFEVNTPDSFGGGYYRYDIQHLIILMEHNHKKVLISISKMKGKSKVGKKAVIIDDQNWNYFYSGINGLNLNIVGGLDTYMYDSESVMIFHEAEADSETPRTVVSLFKWLKAGWAGFNMVKPNHINDGCIRFAQSLKRVMESQLLPDSEDFARHVKFISELSNTEIDSKIREYSLNFERIAKSNKDMSKADFARIIADGGYANVLTREEQVGILILENLKSLVGKPALVKFDFPVIQRKPLADMDKDPAFIEKKSVKLDTKRPDGKT